MGYWRHKTISPFCPEVNEILAKWTDGRRSKLLNINMLRNFLVD
jgi:hypothetical protein